MTDDDFEKIALAAKLRDVIAFMMPRREKAAEVLTQIKVSKIEQFTQECKTDAQNPQIAAHDTDASER